MCERRRKLLQVTTTYAFTLVRIFHSFERGKKKGKPAGGSPDLVKKGGSARRSYTKQGQQEVVPVSQVLSAVPTKIKFPILCSKMPYSCAF